MPQTFFTPIDFSLIYCLLEFCQLLVIGVNGNNLTTFIKQERVIALVKTPVLDDLLLSLLKSAELCRMVQVIKCHDSTEHTLATIQIYRHMNEFSPLNARQGIIMLVAQS